MPVFMGLNISMQMTMIMYNLTLPPELDGGLFEDVSSFLSLDVPYEVQQTTVEFISKLHIIIDKFTPLQTEPILSNIRTHYNLDTKQQLTILNYAKNVLPNLPFANEERDQFVDKLVALCKHRKISADSINQLLVEEVKLVGHLDQLEFLNQLKILNLLVQMQTSQYLKLKKIY
jgi:hypothetical protein